MSFRQAPRPRMGNHQTNRRVCWLGFVYAALLMNGSACGGGGGDDGGIVTPPDSTLRALGSLVGVINIRDEVGSVPVPGATITIGTVSVTSAQDGRFEVPNIPTGAAAIRVTAPGFEPVQQGVLIQAAGSFVIVSLLRVNAMSEAAGFLIYVPSGVTKVRGVFFLMMGGSLDSRPFVRDEYDEYQRTSLTPPADLQAYRLRLLTLARKHGLALMGSTAIVRASGPGNTLQALATIGAQSGRPELVDAPLLFHGHSNGTCDAYGFTIQYPERVIGFVIDKPPDCLTQDASPAIAVPGYLFFGEFDPVVPTAGSTLTALFERHRANGAAWALAVERGALHAQVADRDLLSNWMDAVLTRRLPETTTNGTPVQLRPVDAAVGWLGNQTSRAIADYKCFAGDKLRASWLPSEQTARDWQALVSSRSVTTVTACAP